MNKTWHISFSGDEFIALNVFYNPITLICKVLWRHLRLFCTAVNIDIFFKYLFSWQKLSLWSFVLLLNTQYNCTSQLCNSIVHKCFVSKSELPYYFCKHVYKFCRTNYFFFVSKPIIWFKKRPFCSRVFWCKEKEASVESLASRLLHTTLDLFMTFLDWAQLPAAS